MKVNLGEFRYKQKGLFSKMQKHMYFGKDLEAMSFAQNYHRWILEEFLPYLNGLAAEVGAGSGNFTDLLSKTKIEHLYAFEPSENMYIQLINRFNDNAKVTAFNKYFLSKDREYNSHFNTVIYVNVLEHIGRDHDELLYALQTLKQGGTLCIFAPAHAWLYSDLDKQVGHFRRYRKKDLEKLVTDAGFEIVKTKYFDMLGIIPWYLAFVLFRKTITGTNVSIYDRFIVPIIRKLEMLVPPPIGKNILLVAQKPMNHK